MADRMKWVWNRPDKKLLLQYNIDDVWYTIFSFLSDSTIPELGSSGAPDWGDIGGDLVDQVDLQTELEIIRGVQDVEFTYTLGVLTRVDYEDGSYKEFTYNLDGTVDEIVWTRSGDIVTKTFVYDIDGNLDEIQTVVT